MDELTSVKRELKKWEGAFYYTHRRKPTKDDIDNAPDDVKAQYKRYTDLKKQTATSQPEVEVWGTALNKVKATPEVKVTSKVKPAMSAMQKLSQKLRANSQFGPDKIFSPKGLSSSKLNNRKAEEAFSHETNENSPDNTKSLDSEDFSGTKKPSIILEKALKLSQSKSWSSPLKCVEKAETTNPLLYRQFSAKKKPVLNSKFLQQHAEQIDVHQEVVKNIRGEMEEEEEVPQDEDEKPRKKKGKKWQAKVEESGDGMDNVARDAWLELKESHLQKEEERLKNSQASLGKSNWNPLTNTDNTVVKSSLPSAFEDWEDLPPFDDEEFAASMEMEMDTEVGKELSQGDSNVNDNENTSVSSSKSKSFKLDNFMKNKNQKSVNGKAPVINTVNKTGSQVADDVNCDNEVDSHLSLKDKSRSKRKRQESEPESNETSDVTWRSDSRCGQYPEDMNVPSDPEDADVQEQQVTESKPKRRKVTAAPKKVISQDNFVRLNMKVKRFSRGGTRMKGEAYKRMAWKKKMSERSSDYGSKCFKCGEAGHWAKKCPGKGKKKELPGGWAEGGNNMAVDEAAFPSLKQAMQMARGIRTPKTAANKKPAVVRPSSQQVDDPDAVNDIGSAQQEGDEEYDLDVVRSVYEAPPAPEGMAPLYELTDDGQLPETPSEVYDALRVFGFSSFRGGQEQAVMRILCGQSTLVVLSTGAGKSLCYQLPAYLYGKQRQATALVISPLVSLMDDQVANLPAGLNGACLHTGMTKGHREKVLASLKEGNIHFLLVSPEALVGGGQQGLLPHNMPPISFACIDEAHCVSEWSHHFRPSYLRICKVLRERFGVRCMLGLTATATLTTAASVAQHLGIHDYQEATIRGTPVPDNLLLSVSKDENRDESLLSLLQGERFSGCSSIIIYCTRRDQTTRLATLIRTCLKDARPPEPEEAFDEQAKEEEEEGTKKKGKGRKKAPAKKPKKKRDYWDAEAYHAGLTACQRRRVQTQFMEGYLRVVVATVAFGMGLDKSDVRGIIHYNLPKTFESYVQEIGRAGRDGKPAHCHVFLDQRGGDISELKRHIFSNTVDCHVIKKLVQKVFPPCRCRAIHEKHSQAMQDCGETPAAVDTASGRICPGHERAVPIENTVQSLDMKEEGLSTLLCYLELHPSHWVENLTPVYANCRISCYGGPQQMQEVAKKCPPVAVAIAREKQRGKKHGSCKDLEFNVVEVSDSMGWESGPVKKELKLLQWNLQTPDSGPRKSGVMVEFSDLGFHLRSPGDFLDEEIDEIVNFLNSRVTTQEKTDLAQLRRFYRTLARVAHRDVWMCCDRVDTLRSDRLKTQLREYFEHQPQLDDGCVTHLTFTREAEGDEDRLPEEGNGPPAESAIGDIRAFIHMYGQEHTLTGRSIARVFHGIPSPCFPPEVWGRVRRFWRAHLDIDFNALRQVATQQLIHMR